LFTLNTTSTVVPLQAGEQKRQPLVYVIVLNWNRWRDTEECVAALVDLDYSNYRLIVVDNASTDGSVERLKASTAVNCELVRADVNLGYAGGNNLGIRLALAQQAEYIWILNNDARPQPQTLYELVLAAAAQPNYGVLASPQIRLSDRENIATAFFDRDDRLSGIHCTGCEQPGSSHRADGLRGPSLLLRSPALRAVGLFDESYFHYYEDDDLMERMRLGGWALGLACRAPVLHSVGASLPYGTPQALYYLWRNRLLFQRRFSGDHPFRTAGRHLRELRNAMSLRRAVMTWDFRQPCAVALGIIDAVRGRTGPRDLGASYRVVGVHSRDST
jgi:GT2 family glycosyltransferase